MSRLVGNQYEKQARQYLESVGLLHIASNIVVPGGEIDLLMQSSIQLDDRLVIGELCIVEVKGRNKVSIWNEVVVSARKAQRWRLASQHVLWRLEEGEWSIPLSLTGVQLVLIQIENQQLEVNWHALDLDLG